MAKPDCQCHVCAGSGRGYTYSEEWRRITEARQWLRWGYNTREKIGVLRRMLTGIDRKPDGKKWASRDPESVEALIEEMRAQWRTRSEWMGGDQDTAA